MGGKKGKEENDNNTFTPHKILQKTGLIAKHDLTLRGSSEQYATL